MLRDLRFSRKVHRLQRERAAVLKRYEPLIHKAEEKRDRDESERLTFEESIEIEQIDDQIDSIRSSYIQHRANQFHLPLPKFDTRSPDWENSDFTGWRLSRSAFLALRSQIRAEEHERREAWQNAVLWITAATGLIGALTGLIAAFHIGAK